MAQIIEAAGCGKNALYRHFPGKTDLVPAYLDGFGAARRRQLTDAVTGIVEPGDALLALVRDTARLVVAPEFGGCAFRNYLREVRDPDDAPAASARSALGQARTQLERYAVELDPDHGVELADRINLLVEGMYGVAAYADRRRAAEIAVELAEELVAGARQAAKGLPTQRPWRPQPNG